MRPDSIPWRKRACGTLCVVAVLLQACDTGQKQKAEAQSSVVESHAGSADAPLSWTVRPVRELFRDPTRQEPFSTVTRGTVSADAQGRLYALDDAAGDIVVMDTLGTISARLGRRGAGPGEFRAVSGIGVTSEGALVVFDVAKQALVRFAPDGSILPETRVRGVHQGGPIRVRHGRALLALVSLNRQRRQVERSLVEVDTGGSSLVLYTTSEPLPKGRRFAGCRVPVILPALFTPTLRWTSNDRQVAWSADAEYKVEVRQPLGSMTVKLDVPPVPVTRAIALDEIEASGPRTKLLSGCRISSEEQLDAGGNAEVVPAIADLALTPAGELWVWRRVLGDEKVGTIDVFDTGGRYVGAIIQPTAFPAVFVTEDQFLAVDTDDDGVSHLRLFSLERTAEPAAEGRSASGEP